MGMNNTPASERVHISVFGRRNAGKSSVINAVTGQDLAIVSDVLGTTTDPVYKAMELLPMGPVMLIDTPGIDDHGELGAMRVRKSYQVLNKTDIALLIVDGQTGKAPEDEKLIERFKDKNIPYIVVYNKGDLMETVPEKFDHEIWVSARTGENIHQLKEMIAGMNLKEEAGRTIVGDLVCPGDFFLLVIPIDSAAPKGRLILPQQQTIRDILDHDGCAMIVKEDALSQTIAELGKPPRLVITDSQVFQQVSQDVPEDIPLTSFSILFARYKGDLKEQVLGAAQLENLKDGDKVLIAEGCTHHRQCDDIGTVKMPGWIERYTHKQLEFIFTSGTEFPDDLSPYSLVVHCGGCMLNTREMRYRVQCAKDQNVPVTNYGTLIAYIHGVLERSLEPFDKYYQLLK